MDVDRGGAFVVCSGRLRASMEPNKWRGMHGYTELGSGDLEARKAFGRSIREARRRATRALIAATNRSVYGADQCEPDNGGDNHERDDSCRLDETIDRHVKMGG